MFNGIRCSCKYLSNTYYSNVKLFLRVSRPYSTNAETSPQENISQKIVKVAIIGVPNAGKSTLINSLLDRNICPTSNKVHTTVTKASAIRTIDETQIVFLDTPGLTSPKERKRYKLSEVMINDIKYSLKHADIVGVIQDVGSPFAKDFIHSGIKDLLVSYNNIPSFLILNKVDLLKSKRKLLDIIKNLCNNKIAGAPISKLKFEPTLNGYDGFSDVFMISALERDGITSVMEYIIKNARPGPWMYPPTEWKDKPDEKIIKEMIRAKLLNFLPQEIPYRLSIDLEYFEITADSVACIASVTCPNTRIMNLIAGASNGRLQQMSDSIRFDLVDAFQKSVTMTLTLRAKTVEVK